MITIDRMIELAETRDARTLLIDGHAISMVVLWPAIEEGGSTTLWRCCCRGQAAADTTTILIDPLVCDEQRVDGFLYVPPVDFSCVRYSGAREARAVVEAAALSARWKLQLEFMYRSIGGDPHRRRVIVRAVRPGLVVADDLERQGVRSFRVVDVMDLELAAAERRIPRWIWDTSVEPPYGRYELAAR